MKTRLPALHSLVPKVPNSFLLRLLCHACVRPELIPSLGLRQVRPILCLRRHADLRQPVASHSMWVQLPYRQ